MNMLFQTNNERKRRIFDKSIQKDMIIPFEIYHTNKEFPVTVQPKNARRLKFSDNLWLLFFDQLQSEIVVFAIITLKIYNILLKNGNTE